jgi:archaellum biogenesis ATPase FlaH
MSRIETTILNSLFFDEEYNRKVLPFIDDAYFQDPTERILFLKLKGFFEKYNNIPTKSAIAIELDNDPELTEGSFDLANSLLDIIAAKHDAMDDRWLMENTEKFCQDKAVYNGIMESIAIIDSDDATKSTGSIPEIMTKALSVCFDSHIGHDFLEDAENRFDFYHLKEDRIPFDLEYFNKITKGGLPNKTLNVLLAGTGVGKTLVMCHMAAKYLESGNDVLYITMEMAEERIAERIDANLLNIRLDDIEHTDKSVFDDKIGRLKARTKGKLIIHEYPTAAAGVGQFRHLLNELKLKRNFVPKVIFIDYLNICISVRMKFGANVNSYTYIKSIAEEIRGLAVEKNLPIISATQTTRSGFSNSDPGMEDTSESFGLPATVDWMVALVTNEELEALNQIMVKQLKNRYADVNTYKRFVVGVDRAKMRLYNVEQSAQTDDDQDDTPVMDNSQYGQRAKEDDQMKWATKKMGKRDFSGFNV